MNKTQEKMHQMAVDVMAFAYAPYSQFSVGACIRANNDELFSGCNVENVSFGLTICAEAVALTDMVKQGLREIKEVVIVGSSEEYCSPCGACRQRLLEFSTPETIVHFYNNQGECQTVTMAQLMPYPFSKDNLGDV